MTNYNNDHRHFYSGQSHTVYSTYSEVTIDHLRAMTHKVGLLIYDECVGSVYHGHVLCGTTCVMDDAETAVGVN